MVLDKCLDLYIELPYPTLGLWGQGHKGRKKCFWQLIIFKNCWQTHKWYRCWSGCFFFSPAVWSSYWSSLSEYFSVNMINVVSVTKLVSTVLFWVIFHEIYFFSNSATEAGFNVLRVISEPVACVMAYDIGQMDNTVERYRSWGVFTGFLRAFTFTHTFRFEDIS